MKPRQKKSAKPAPDNTSPTVRRSEQLLIDAGCEFPANRVLATSLGRSQFARRYAERFAESQVSCLFLDIYQSRRALAFEGSIPENLKILCAADPPDEKFDLVAMPLTQGGEAELARDLMQSAHRQLQVGGTMITATDNPKDTWLHQEMQHLFSKVTRKPGRGGVVYFGTKREALKKEKDFRAEFKFRDQGRLITVVTRPGVFSHRRLDTGARAMLEVMEITQGQRVLDLGCGAGVLSLAAALRAEGVTVTAIDSNARAIQCTMGNASLNGIETITTHLNASAQIEEPGTYDVVLANPPYYSDYRIAEIFLKGARRALKPGGRVLFVTKSPAWYEENMPKPFREIETNASRSYSVVSGIRR